MEMIDHESSIPIVHRICITIFGRHVLDDSFDLRAEFQSKCPFTDNHSIAIVPRRIASLFISNFPVPRTVWDYLIESKFHFVVKSCSVGSFRRFSAVIIH
jgi:hypothetical protein